MKVAFVLVCLLFAGCASTSNVEIQPIPYHADLYRVDPTSVGKYTRPTVIFFGDEKGRVIKMPAGQ